MTSTVAITPQFKADQSPRAPEAGDPAPERDRFSAAAAELAQGQRKALEYVDRRGPFRPDHLVSSRARAEASGAERVFRAIEGASLIVLALFLCRVSQPEGLLKAPVGAVLPFLLGVMGLIWGLGAARTYGLERRETLRRALARAALTLLIAAGALALLSGALGLQAGASRALGLWFALSATVVFTLQAVWWLRVRRWRREGRLTPNIVVVGATENAQRLIARAIESREVAVLGVFDDRIGRTPGQVGGVPVLGDTTDLLSHRIMPFVDRVVITVPSRAQGRVRQLIERLRVLPNEVSLFLDIEGEIEQSAVISRLIDAPLARVSGAVQDQNRLLSKRLQDLTLGSLALAAALPIMALVALAVKLDSPGPVLFRQQRHGFNNEPISVWKFRSMRHDAADSSASRQVSADDDRVTRVGRVIRKFSLDELPQIFNVLKGEMSLVGPRPHAIGMKSGDTESARLVAEYAHRHRIKPGITGWAAINGSRGPVNTAEEVRVRVALDVDYIERQSFWLDLYIVAMTLPCLLGDRSAVR